MWRSDAGWAMRRRCQPQRCTVNPGPHGSSRPRAAHASGAGPSRV